jgi:hypothetical protein
MAAQQMILRRDRAITKTAPPRLASSEETFLSILKAEAELIDDRAASI